MSSNGGNAKSKRRSLSASLARMNPFSSSSSKSGHESSAQAPPIYTARDAVLFSHGSRHGGGAMTRSSADRPTIVLGTNSAGVHRPDLHKHTFLVGSAEDKNARCRRTMEDTHSFIYDFGGVEDQGYIGLFDGHAGRSAAEFCGEQLHDVLFDVLHKNAGRRVPDLLDATFTYIDSELGRMAQRASGCTAVVALLMWETRPKDSVPQQAITRHSEGVNAFVRSPSADDTTLPTTTTTTTTTRPQEEEMADSAVAKSDSGGPSNPAESRSDSGASSTVRVLYTANVGDARAVLCRQGRAVRLSYDHKGSDEKESARISSAGGIVVKNRVNGVLAVTRALGDTYMKQLISGHPYTTETMLLPQDEFLILACDGLWDVCSDQEAVDIVRSEPEPTLASKKLVEYALSHFSTDNLTCMVIRLYPDARSSRGNDMLSPTLYGTRIDLAKDMPQLPTGGGDTIVKQPIVMDDISETAVADSDEADSHGSEEAKQS